MADTGAEKDSLRGDISGQLEAMKGTSPTRRTVNAGAVAGHSGTVGWVWWGQALALAGVWGLWAAAGSLDFILTTAGNHWRALSRGRITGAESGSYKFA